MARAGARSMRAEMLSRIAGRGSHRRRRAAQCGDDVQRHATQVTRAMRPPLLLLRHLLLPLLPLLLLLCR